MVTKKHVPKKRTPEVLPELTETELDLLSHLEQGYQLETDTLSVGLNFADFDSRCLRIAVPR
jgi:hypothetical protein